MKWTMALAAALAVTATAAHAGKLDEVRERGELKCGVSTGIVGFSAPDADGVWHGFDGGMCRAVAAATLGDAMAVEFVPVTSKTRFTALESGGIDMLSRATTWTYSRDTDLNVEFAGVNYYDGQAFLVTKALGVTSATELDGATICIEAAGRGLVMTMGKGGVGKTTIAAAVAVELAARGHDVLLTTTDPAAHLSETLAGDTADRLTTPMMRLQDPEQTRILMVTLAETTPVLEAARLQDDLQRAGITPYGWVINASLAATGTTHPVLAARAATEAPQIASVRGKLASRHAVVPMQAGDPVGANRLRALVGRTPVIA